MLKPYLYDIINKKNCSYVHSETKHFEVSTQCYCKKV